MTLRNLFWVIFILAVLLWGWAWWPITMSGASLFVVFFLIAILGWRVFGPTVQG